MEENQNITEIGTAVADMDLQETIRIPQEEEQNEIFHDSMTEEQWREQVDAQASGTDQVPQASETENTDTRTALQKVRDQEGREIQSRLQKRWHDQKQRTAETEQTEGEAEGGSKQYPPTQITKNPRIPKQRRFRNIRQEKLAERYRIWDLTMLWERKNWKQNTHNGDEDQSLYRP